MDLRQIKNIIKEFEESKIDKLEISDSEFSIKLEKNTNRTFSNIPSVPVEVVAAPAATPRQETAPAKEEQEELYKITAPLVGTYYEAPSPDANPFVAVNQRVQKGDPLFIIEAMKVMNEITAPVSGTVVKIHISDATMVEYGQVIMEIRE